jgi:uncharacterized protein YndB with AHSA1/START domain
MWQVLGILIGALVVLMAALFLWGSALPEAHTASAMETIPATPGEVFQRISDIRHHAQWRKEVKSIEIVADDRWIEDTSNGRIPFRRLEVAAPSRMVTRIDTDQLPFEGTWTYTLRPIGGGTEVSITEEGRVKSAIFRALGRLFFPHDKTMKEYLADLRLSFTS